MVWKPVGIDENGRFPTRVTTALETSFAPTQRAFPKGPRLAAIGDSIIAAGVGTNERLFGKSIQSRVSWESGGRLSLCRNAGVAGNTTAQMLSRFDTDITPWQPDVVLIRGGVNDSANGVSTATFKANIIALVQKTYAINAVPVLDTISPVDYAGASQNATIIEWNKWLLGWAYANGVRCANSWAAAVASTGYTWPDATYTSDGIHPVSKGQKIIADAIKSAVWDLPVWPMKTSALASGSLVSNALFTSDANSDGLADSWTSGGDATGATYSTITDANISGKVQKITLPSQSASKYAKIEQTINVSSPAKFNAGDLIRLSAKVRVTSTDSNAGQVVRGELTMFAWSQGPYDVVTYVEPGSEFQRVSIEYRARTTPNDQTWTIQGIIRSATDSGSTGGAGTLELGEVEILNLTRNGLAPTMTAVS